MVSLPLQRTSVTALLLGTLTLLSGSSTTAFQGRFRKRVISPAVNKLKNIRLSDQPTAVYNPKGIQLNSTAIGVPLVQQNRIYTPRRQRQATTSSLTLVPSRTTLAVAGGFLALNTGFLNGVALSGLLFPAGAPCQAVAACTGAYTNFAVAAATSSQALYGNMFQIGAIVSYSAGSLVNGLLNPEGVQWQSRVPAKSLLLSAALVASAFVLQPVVASPRLVWYALTIACGIQNSFTSMLVAGNVLRSAHFSGITSDLGTVVGQALRGNREHIWKAPIWAGLVSCFVAGGFVSVRLLPAMGRKALLVPLSMYLMVGASASVRQRVFAQQEQRRESTGEDTFHRGVVEWSTTAKRNW